MYLLPAVARLRVPVQVHLHDDPDPWGAESGSWSSATEYPATPEPQRSSAAPDQDSSTPAA